jgi:predicted SAM-dependent methyltransferase
MVMPKDEMRLNFGCADVQPEGWINVDKEDYGQEHVGDLLDGLPFADDYFDCIVANHSIQCIRFDDLQRGLIELRRVLKPGGTLRILVPDAARAVFGWQHGDIEFPISEDIERTHDGRFLRYLLWHGDARSAFTVDSLIDALERAGFPETMECFYKRTEFGPHEILELDSRRDESIIVEARK